MYPPEIVAPMIAELENAGFESLHTVSAVDEAIKRPGTTLVVENAKKPDHLVTVFAGFDIDATAQMRDYMLPFPPSSPSIALFKDGELVHMLERHHIEGRFAEAIAENLEAAYNEFC